VVVAFLCENASNRAIHVASAYAAHCSMRAMAHVSQHITILGRNVQMSWGPTSAHSTVMMPVQAWRHWIYIPAVQSDVSDSRPCMYS
jgi:hypothetical protein